MRTIGSILLLIFAILSVFFAPFLVQGIFIALVIFLVRPAVLAFIPAILSDLAYSPGATQGFLGSIKATGVTIGILFIYWLLKTKTRLFQLYDFLEKEKEI